MLRMGDSLRNSSLLLLLSSFSRKKAKLMEPNLAIFYFKFVRQKKYIPSNSILREGNVNVILAPNLGMKSAFETCRTLVGAQRGNIY